MHHDRRDRAVRGETEWQQFRTEFAASRLFTFLLGELNEIAPNYGAELRTRLSLGIAAGEDFAESDPDSDGPALVPRLGDGEPAMMDLSDARLLEEQLFPDREPHDHRDFHQITRGMAIVTLHSVLERYATSIGATKPRTPLPKAISGFLGAHGALPEKVSDALTEFDETRHLIVHNSGIVDERYRNSVKYNNLVEGELCPLSAGDLDRYHSTVWHVALALKSGLANDA